MTRCASFLPRPAWVLLGLLGLAACAPALDWREVRLGDSGLSALFPCKPLSQTRRVRLGPDPVRLELHACTADTATWAVAFAELDDPARVGGALVALRDAAALNFSASSTQPRALQVEGATPNPASQRVQLQGRLPDGRALSAGLAVFAKGTRVFQATVVSHQRDPDAEAIDGFFANLRFAP
jgi:hypothetical protein